MATNSQFEIILSFKAVMDGLNTFVNGYKRRMEEVAAFNQRIQNGGAGLQQILTQVGTVLSAVALAKYAKDAAEADKVQQQLIRTLERTKQTGALEALNAQATALQRMTHFTDEAVTNVQRYLINAGLSAKQTQDLTERVLDFAQETGQSAESAALLIARTLRGQTDELGRYNIRLDTSKGKVDALRDALEKFASGSARGAVADPRVTANAARFADATENLGRAINRLVTPFLTQLVPLMERATIWFTAFADAILPIVPALGSAAESVLKLLGVLLVFRGVATLTALAINPLRLAFVALAGMPLLELSNILGVCTQGMGAMGTATFILKDGVSSLAGAGRFAASGLAVAGAAIAGWELGKMINEIQLGGMAIKDWVAIAIVWIGDKLGGIWSLMQKQWAVTRTAGEAFWDALKLVTLQGVITILEAWNKLPFGQKLKADLSPLRKEFDTTAEHILGTGDRLNKQLGDIDKDRAAQVKENAELIQYMMEEGAKAATKGSAPGAPAGAAGGAPSKDLNNENFGVDQAQMFELQTKLLQAQLAGNQAEVDRLNDLLEELKLKQELLQLEEKAGPLITSRLKVQVAARGKIRDQAADEVNFQRALGTIEIKRADIEADRLLSTREKQAQINDLIVVENRLLDEKISKNETLLKQGVTDEEKGRLLQEIATLRKQLAENQRTKEGTRDLSVGEGAIAGAKGFQDEVGTAASNASDAIQGGLNSALQGTSDLLVNVISRAQTFKQAWQGAIISVGQNFTRMAADMVAKMIWRATVERALTALGVTTHVAGEGAKTAATTVGAGIRLAMVIKEALAAVYHGAVAAFSALANIPIVGPFLGAAAMAAAIVGGIALVGKIGHADGGIIRGPGGPRDDRIPAMLSNGEHITRASSVSLFGEGFFNALNAGVLDLSALPDSVARQLPAAGAAGSQRSGGGSATSQAAPAAASGDVHLAFHNTENDAAQFLKGREGRRFLVDFIGKTVRDMS